MSSGAFITTTRRGKSVVRVEMTPHYLPAVRLAQGGEHCFAYIVAVHNEGETGLKLLARRWEIVDGNNDKREVQGEGVVGEQPAIAAGYAFQYTSYVDFKTPVGYMRGGYTMRADNDEEFEAAIDWCAFAVPGAFSS